MTEHLLRESKLILPKAISAGHAAEETRKHARDILTSNETIHLHKISKHSKSRSQGSAQATEIIKKCKFCENSHHRGKCPAYGKVCHNCNRKNHFKKCCPRNRKPLHEIERMQIFPWYDKFSKKTLKIWLAFLKSKMNPPIGISYKIDTGAQCNVIPVESLENISLNQIFNQYMLNCPRIMAQKFR